MIYYFALFYCLLDMSCSECGYILVFYVNCLVKQFAICLGVVVILLLNVMEVLSVGALLVKLCMVFQRLCVLCP